MAMSRGRRNEIAYFIHRAEIGKKGLTLKELRPDSFEELIEDLDGVGGAVTVEELLEFYRAIGQELLDKMFKAK